MKKPVDGRRRNVIKTLALSGLAFSGINGLGPIEVGADTRETKAKHWDVIVVGGGPGGIPSAVAAARNGARVLLVEQYGFLGGMATSALVHPFMKYFTNDRLLTLGLFWEFLSLLEKQGAIDPQRRVIFDDEQMKILLDRFVLDAGIDLLLHARAVGVLKDGDDIKAVRVFHKGGIEDLSADIFIDSTGDGDIAAWGGAEIEIGRREDNACQPMTACFRMANVDTARIPDGRERWDIYQKGKADGEFTNPRENILFFPTLHEDVIHFNTTRVVGETSLDGWSMTRAEIEGRRQIDEMARFFQKRLPGFENAYISKSATQIGVRESRRVIGSYVLTADDVLSARHFEDGITCANYDIDIHNPAGTGTEIKRLEENTWYDIPYRCLLPNGVGNLIVASRCISADHAAHSSLRVMPIVWGVGHAAGIAAAMCVNNNMKPGAVDTDTLRAKLIEEGAFLG